jgi:hypothetical protein
MKHVYFFLFFILFGSYQAKAVLPDGTVAPDWTLTDLERKYSQPSLHFELRKTCNY